jgi:hypothetical protein
MKIRIRKLHLPWCLIVIGVFNLSPLVGVFGAGTHRILMHTSQDGAHAVRTILLESGSAVQGQTTREGARNVRIVFSLAHERFEQLWNELMSSGAMKYKDTSSWPSAQKHYVFSIGEGPRGVHTNFKVPKDQAPPAVIKLDREFRDLVKMAEQAGRR